jgi:HEAT repeat protein
VALADPDSAVRVAAADALGRMGSVAIRAGSGRDVVRAGATGLVRSLKDPEPDVRCAAATSLGIIASTRPKGLLAASPIDRKAVMDALVETLGDRDAKVRGAVLRAVASDNPNARAEPPEALAKGLKDESAENRVAAVDGVVNFGRGLDRWVPVLLELADHDPNPSVRRRALQALNHPFFGPTGVTAAVVPALIPRLRSGDPRRVNQIIRFAGRLGRDARATIPDLLRILNEPLDPKLAAVQEIEVMEDDDPGSEAASALGSIAPGTAEAKQVIAALTDVARSGPLIRRTRTVYALGRFGPAAVEAVPVLIGIINDPTSAKYIHEEIEAARGQLNKRKPDSAHVHSVAEAARALGPIAPGTPEADRALTALLPVLNSDAPYCREAAIAALGRFGPKAAVAIPRIRTLKDDRDPSVRNAVTQVLPLIEAQGKAN